MYKHIYLVTLDLEEYPLNVVRLPYAPEHPPPPPPPPPTSLQEIYLFFTFGDLY